MSQLSLNVRFPSQGPDDQGRHRAGDDAGGDRAAEPHAQDGAGKLNHLINSGEIYMFHF